MGERWEVIEKHELDPFISGVYENPTHHFHERLEELKIPFEPEFVIDDYPEVVAAFGGAWVPPYFFARNVDQQMDRIYQIVCDFAKEGTSEGQAVSRQGNRSAPLLTQWPVQPGLTCVWLAHPSGYAVIRRQE